MFSGSRLVSFEGRNSYGHTLWLYECVACNTVKGPSTVSHIKRPSVCGECPKDYETLYGYRDIWKYKYSSYRQGAKVRRLAFEVTVEDIRAVWDSQKGICALTGVELDFKSEASLDRIDSSQGYLTHNIQWVHKRINLMKSDLPEADFVRWCKLVGQQSERKL